MASPLQKTTMDHKITWIGRDLWKLASSSSLLKPYPVNLGKSVPILLSLKTAEKEIAQLLQAPAQCLVTFLSI